MKLYRVFYLTSRIAYNWGFLFGQIKFIHNRFRVDFINMKHQKQQTNKHIVRSIEKLTAYRSSLEDSINDYLNTLTLNRQVISILLQGLNPSSPQIKKNIQKLLSEPLFTEIQKIRKNQEFEQAELLMQQQIIDEQLLFNVQMLNSHLQQIDDMRKLMHDKEYSYSNIVQKLNAYEQLPEEDVRTTAGSIKMVCNQKMNRQMVSRISHQKQQLQKKIKDCQKEKQMYKEKFRQIISLIKENVPFDKIKRLIDGHDNDTRSQHAEVNISACKPQKTQNHQQNMMYCDNRVDIKPNHKELMKILKKEFISTQLYQEQLFQSVEVTKDVKAFNKELLKDQVYLDRQLKYYNQKLQKIRAKHRMYFHGEKPKQQIVKMEVQKPKEESESSISTEQQKEQKSKVPLKGIMRIMMVKSGSEPNLGCVN